MKRGQLASILVKAFDLPRYSVYELKNPFKDVHLLDSHSPNILTLYKLGITTGTSPDKFSVNAPVTRGQAAKLMKATEENKPTTMVTLEAETLRLDELQFVAYKTDTDLYKSIEVYGKPGYTKTKIQLIPLKEGKGTLHIRGTLSDKPMNKKFYVYIKKVNGELKLTLEETADYLPTEALLQVAPNEEVKNVSLSTLDGKLVSDNVSFGKCAGYETGFTCIKIEEPGKYIATVRFAAGEDVRYAIEAKVPEMDKFQYDMKTLRERTTYVFDVERIFDGYDYYDKEAAKIAVAGPSLFHGT
ncbi:hypothetical protein SporoP37_04880 [Sporosarcina sp. P37]|uniref:S-layer homology domain-containing protein n=1 Tax=unclassified Sporosarcina TaxID=2647733 RepID=UPI000A17D2C0|nr:MULTISPECIES: S-layer homology domain-containing protein [unclassified Sporosarcina]ARK24081.1 hypothetical protein SporoP37_04880 [Sporosarcina sp. P37]PID18527.1 S-layer homology domain-containing protein [Sporosarcina sp. P35]